ncbi:hypothetical protein H2200_008201 [Cladophialophora chaetospira]|uniref:Transcription factor domain-containing protein n=1 Tax=Cladophialophora chaetospira TaxID=386627 RepID=A0AA38X5E7_9EURO|nr:hypothetical protein H2200_008201 [Cladophialophora chaetospira]
MVPPTLDETFSFHSPPSRVETNSSPVGITRWGSPAPYGLPSLYTSSPMDVLGSLVSQQLSEGFSFQQPSPMKRTPIQNSRLADIPQGMLVEYIEFFRVKILYCVPVIDDADLRDPTYVIQQKRPLAYCAAFIASQFIPGSTAFAVLYAYRPAADVYQLPAAPTSPPFLNRWVLKNSIEAFAIRAGLHRSIDDLRALLRSSSQRTSESLVFHKYIYWLWLVAMSHHFSLMTRTSPSIREDSSISSAVDLLRDVPRPPRVTRILAEIDLYTLWQRAGRRDPGLAEWWCTPSNTQSPEELLGVLEDMDGALEVWGQRWGLRGEPNTTISNVDISANGAVEFHFRRMHFCVATFGTQHILERTQSVLDKDSATGAELEDAARESILKSVKAAHDCARCLVDIPPLRRETVRYMSEFGYGLIAFCCIYMIQAHKLFGAALPDLERFLTSVEEVATFMSEMAVANNAAPRLYGQTIMRLLRQENDDVDDARDDTHFGAARDFETGEATKISYPA